MSILYMDLFSGIAGDMFLGALIDLGADFNYLIENLKKVDIGEYEVVLEDRKRGGILSKGIRVIFEKSHHHHTHFGDIKNKILDSKLEDDVKELALNIFSNIAEAEAKSHGVNVEHVHFHEVGAVDSIVDIVGSAILLSYFNFEKIIASHVNVGSGIVDCSHGKFSVPAPATSILLKNIPIFSFGVNGELTTPTGAAILKSCVSEFVKEFPSGEIVNVGRGGGSNDYENWCNILNLYEIRYRDGLFREKVMMVETNIDDMNPQLYDILFDKLFDVGALDVFLENVIMKKTRPGVLLKILCKKENIENITKVVFENSTTIGVRFFEMERMTLKRKSFLLDTSLGKVEIKANFFDSRGWIFVPEYESLKEISTVKGLPLINVKKVIDLEVKSRKDELISEVEN